MFISGFVIRIIALVSSQLRWLTATGIREEFYGLLSQIMALSKDICGTVSSLLPRLPPSFSSLAVSNEERGRVSVPGCHLAEVGDTSRPIHKLLLREGLRDFLT